MSPFMLNIIINYQWDSNCRPYAGSMIKTDSRSEYIVNMWHKGCTIFEEYPIGAELSYFEYNLRLLELQR